MLTRLASSIFKVIEVITIALVGVMVVDVTLQIVFRYIIGKSMFWTEEIGRYTLVWIVFLAASIAVRKRKHIDVDFIVSHFHPFGQKITAIVGDLLMFVCASIFVYYGLQIVSITMRQHSAALHIPMGFIYMAIPTCGVLIIIQMLTEF